MVTKYGRYRWGHRWGQVVDRTVFATVLIASMVFFVLPARAEEAAVQPTQDPAPAAGR